MSIPMAALIGVLFAAGTYLMMHRTMTRIILGFAVLANAVNLLIITAGGPPGSPPVLGEDGVLADPVPQALVLTAIVIGFGIQAFLLALAWRNWTLDGNDEVEDDIADRRLAERAGLEETPEEAVEDVATEVDAGVQRRGDEQPQDEERR
ncbi:Na(+)/H(+) antiporter subunit C [Iamia majanohamensis]|uniref:Na(+)/H(+) antiporter subunit C n=1 Tax=Iamia majanohamensis TaxID=467976 RepID=A0AAE9YET8_9ACTN|nr:Na(+)/H(+) antiporter subunit C [Iamia majanohamensis]WCO67277.1 Na(+)/H(+) antiporter subunit C [Iamia majanohamensis]